jgi:hypothetical protein
LRETLRRSREPHKAGPTGVKETFGTILKSHFEAGAFGRFEKTHTTKDGTPIKISGQALPDDPALKSAALIQMGAARDEFNRWVDEHPEAKATDPDTIREMNRIGGAYAGRAFVAPMPVKTGNQATVPSSVDDVLNKHGYSFPTPTPVSTPVPDVPNPTQEAIDAENERRAKAAKGKSTKQREREEAGPSSNIATAYTDAPMPDTPSPVDDDDDVLLLPTPQ